jgi:hypothetical protein
MQEVGLVSKNAETRDRTGDLQIFSLTLSQLSYRGTGFLRVASPELCFVGLAALGLAMGAGIRKPSACGRPAQVAWPMLEAVDVCGAGSRARKTRHFRDVRQSQEDDDIVFALISLNARKMFSLHARYMLVTCLVTCRVICSLHAALDRVTCLVSSRYMSRYMPRYMPRYMLSRYIRVTYSRYILVRASL